MASKNTFFGTLARGLLTRMSRGRLPDIEGTLTISGLDAPAEIIRDRWGIPHIYAENIADLFFAQGFVHAQDRLFQMEMNRRTALGTLSEIFGELSLETDRITRTFGFNRLGFTDFEHAQPEIKDTLTAYAAGVNAFMDHPDCNLPLELRLLTHIPKTWEPEDSAVFSRLMIWQMSHAWQSEIIRAEIADKVGVDNAAELEVHYPSSNPSTLPKGIEFNTLDPDGNLRNKVGPFHGRGKGSNEWAVGPARSESGHAVLCNDIHLQLGIPSLWYQVHLNAPGYHVTGVSLPGLPMVLVGHNERIAWGITLAFTDAEDLFVEHIDKKNPPRFLYKDEWHNVKIIEEAIKVKGTTDPVVEKVLVTRHGPVISDQVGYENQQVSIQSMSLQPLPALQGWYQLNVAQNWNEFVDSIRLIEAPQLNIAYADVEDNIGYYVTGKVPVRAKGDGSIPAEGWSGDYEWVGEVPFDEMPHAFNPDRGYILNCNNKIAAEGYPHHLGNVWMNGYRARRLEELIESRNKISMQDHRDFQMDLKCIPGLELVGRLEGVPETDADVQLALKMLRTWDGFLTPESTSGTVYQVLRYSLIRELLSPGLGDELANRLMGKGFHPLLAKAQELYGHDTTTLLRLLDDSESWWVRQAGGREAVLQRSIKQAISWLRDTLGTDETQWHWGKLHQLTLSHPLSLRSPFDQVFNLGPYPIGGDTDTPLQTAMMPDDPYDNTGWAPSYRQIIDMSDFTKAQAIHPPGQSGQLGSPYYDNFIQSWLEGEYTPMLWTREQVESQAEGKLILQSKDKTTNED